MCSGGEEDNPDLALPLAHLPRACPAGAFGTILRRAAATKHSRERRAGIRGRGVTLREG